MIFRVCSLHVYFSIASRRAASPSLFRSGSSSTNLSNPATKDPTSPGSTTQAVRPCSSISPIWSRRDATIPFPIAMYSNSLVGEPKKGGPSGLGTWGDTTISQAARCPGPLCSSAFREGPDETDDEFSVQAVFRTDCGSVDLG